MVWINNSNAVALNSLISDGIPAGSSFVASGLSSGYPVPGGTPPGSTNIGVSCTDTSTSTMTTMCYFEGPTTAYPRGRVIWAGTLGPDPGAAGPADADHEIVINFRVNIQDGTNTLRNEATVDVDRNRDGDAADPGEQQAAAASKSWTRQISKRLPSTGFAPNITTDLRHTPPETYIQTGGITLDIPALGVNIPVVGVPFRRGGWNVSWLGEQAGWLEGSAFPSWNGNSVLTGHVYLASGLPGPFVRLSSLKYGDNIVIHAYGQKYIFAVQSNTIADANDSTVMRHEDKPWLTLVTCKDYDAQTGTYKKRVVVRAVLVRVEWD
jgi:LPXTG-site transpeptidase (sortase) family protein